MSHYRYVFYVIMIFCSISCQQRDRAFIDKISQDQISCIDSIADGIEVFSASKDSLSIATIIDSVICLFNSKGKDNVLVLKPLDPALNDATYFMHGEDKDQFLLPMLSHHQGNLLLYDIVLKKAALVNVKEAVSSERYSPEIHMTNIISQKIIPSASTGPLLFLNQYSYNGKEARIKYSDRHWNSKQKIKSPFYFNICSGYIIQNSLTKQIAYLGYSQPFVEILEESGNLTKRIILNRKEQLLDSYSHDKMTEYVYLESVVECFTAGDGCDSFFVGAFTDDFDVHRILFFSWDGRLIGGFKTAYPVNYLSLSESDNALYCWESHDCKDVLIKYEYELK